MFHQISAHQHACDSKDVTDGEDTEECKSQIRQRRYYRIEKSKQDLLISENEDFTTCKTTHLGKGKALKFFSESYFTVKGAALILPQNDYEGLYTRRLNTSNGGDIQKHLQAMFCWLRPEDTIRLAVRLESNNPKYIRYMVVMSCSGCHDTEEAAVLGLDLNDEIATIGLVFPIWAHTKLDLEGDGGFSITPEGRPYNFQPVSVQAMWSALQSLNKVLKMANDNMYLPRGLTHTWVGYYSSRIESEKSCIAEWNKLEDLHTSYRHRPEVVDDQSDLSSLYKAIKTELKNVMMRVDFEEVTTKFIREAVEKAMGMSLKEHRNFIDLEIINIMGQMDAPTKIEEYLYLGSEWNASNLEELQQNGVGYILNVSREIDNFFPEVLRYLNVREWDVKEANLLKYWEDTHKFITHARQKSSKTLVHCKMGISRSASTVIAFLMKEHNWSRQEAFDYTKARRSIINPNEGFWKQLETYEGILTASRQRKIFLEKSAHDLRTASAPLVDPDVAIDLGSDIEIPQDADLLLRQKLGKTASGSERDDLILKFEPEIDNVSRSTDSTEESLSDIPSPVITEAPSRELGEFTDPKFDTKKFTSSDLADSENESLKGSEVKYLSSEDEKSSKISVLSGFKLLTKDEDKSRSSTEGTSIIDPTRLSAEICSSIPNSTSASSLQKFRSDSSWIKAGASQKEEEGEKEENDEISEVCGSVDKLGETLIGEKDTESGIWIEFRKEKIQIGEEKEAKTQIKKVKEEDECQTKDKVMDPSRVENTKYTSGEAMKYIRGETTKPERNETADFINKEPGGAGCIETSQRGSVETTKFTYVENALCSSVDATKSENMESTKQGISKSSTILGLAIKEHYTKENIPWNAGTVLKQRQDFEDRWKPAIDCDRARTESISSDASSQASLSPTLQKKEKLLVKLSPSDDSGMATISSHVSVELRTDSRSKNTSRLKTDDVSKTDSGLVSNDKPKTECRPFVDLQKVDIEEHAKQTGLTDEDTGSVEKADEEDGPNARARLSVYDMEDIQLPPGIVRRTTQEIEERHNILTDTVDPSQKCPIKRSSSLKAVRVTPKSKDRDSERRKTCMAVLSPTSSNSDLKTPESSSREASCTIMDSSTDCTVPTKCCLDFEFEKEMREKGENFCLSGEQAAIKVYKLFGEEVTVQEGLVKKQKMDIEAMERDVGKRAQTRTNQADVPNLPSPTKSALLIQSLPQTICSDAITQTSSGIPKTSFLAQLEANSSTKMVQISDKNIVLNHDQGITTDLILSQNKCSLESLADNSKSFAELKQGFVSKCSTISTGSEGISLKKSQSGMKKCPKPESRFDEETLELIREIGSALLNSPSKVETKDKTDISKEGSLVKHLVKNIERKTRAMRKPSKEIIIVDKDASQKRKPFNEESKSKEISIVVESKDVSPKYSCPAGVVPKSAKSSYIVTPAAIKTGLQASESKIIPDVSADVHQSHENLPKIQQQYSGFRLIQVPAESTTVAAKEECKTTSTRREKTPVTDDTESCSVKNLVGKFESPSSHSKMTLESAASVSGMEIQSDKPAQIIHKSVLGDLVLKVRESEKSSEAVALREKLVKFARTRPKSADHFRAIRVEGRNRGSLQQSKTLPESETNEASTLSWQGRKVQKLYGKSHPLSKLEQDHVSIRKSPFYSTM
ncbi:hypothetical protein CHS0354_028884 [Potamilus streckersoni]|uniref:protein-serine/threonine phosphatase n=1 Tax=Potamilus streckersoni TaxID=2493646 RepID=A0AAE0VSN2_9BIVA|nr:hypothetical protein CHS0354_028884 [Potamilus streckersoni]